MSQVALVRTAKLYGRQEVIEKIERRGRQPQQGDQACWNGTSGRREIEEVERNWTVSQSVDDGKSPCYTDPGLG
jgi:hypothetical protein